MSPERTGRSTEHGSALDKALLVLEHLTVSERPLGLADLAESVALPKQTVHRILQQLVNAQLILRAPQKDRYVIGPGLTRLSVQALNSVNIGLPIRRVLAALASESGETCNVGILDKDEVVYIERVEGPSPLRLQLDVGSRVPIHCTAIGKLMMAHQHKNIRNRFLNACPLEKYTGTTLTDAAALEQEFSRIRSEGYSFNDQEFVDGLTAIAVAIRDAENRVVAAVAVHAPSSRMDLEKARSYVSSMEDKARSIALAWGLLEEPVDGMAEPAPALSES